MIQNPFRYLLLPFYVGDVFGRMHIDRKGALEMSKKYLNEYFKLIKHYDVVPKNVRANFEIYKLKYLNRFGANLKKLKKILSMNQPERKKFLDSKKERNLKIK